jgi:hypothetical protein
MNQTIHYTKTAAVAIVSMYALVAGILAILGVFNAVPWSDVTDWLLKLGLAAGILLVIAVVMGVLVDVMGKNK